MGLLAVVGQRMLVWCKMATVKVKVFYGPSYDRCKVISLNREVMAKMTFETFSNRVRQNVGYENSSRIQYRDDEETFITMNSDDDFVDALRCIDLSGYELR